MPAYTQTEMTNTENTAGTETYKKFTTTPNTESTQDIILHEVFYYGVILAFLQKVLKPSFRNPGSLFPSP